MTHQENPELKEIHEVLTGEFKGTKFYSLQNIKKISAQRGLAALAAERFLDMKIDEKTLKRLLEEHRLAAKTLDIEKAFAIVYEIRARLEFITEEKSLLDLCCVYFMIEGEDIEIPSEEINAKKVKIMQSNPATRGFFLRIALNLTRSLTAQEEESLISYLEETKALAERVNRFFPSVTNKNSENSTNT